MRTDKPTSTLRQDKSGRRKVYLAKPITPRSHCRLPASLLEWIVRARKRQTVNDYKHARGPRYIEALPECSGGDKTRCFVRRKLFNKSHGRFFTLSENFMVSTILEYFRKHSHPFPRSAQNQSSAASRRDQGAKFISRGFGPLWLTNIREMASDVEEPLFF